MTTFTTRDGATLAYTRTGSGTPTLLFVHGWHARATVWDEFVAAFADTWSTLAVDLRGFGDSRDAHGPFTFERASDDLAEVLDAQGIDRVVVVGHSMGGTIAQRFAADHPERVHALVLIAPVPSTGLPLSDGAKAFFRSTAGDRDALQRFLDALAFGGAFDAATNDRLLAYAAAGSPAAARASFESWAHADFEGDARTIAAPTLVVSPSDDRPLTPAFLRERVADVLPNARMIVIAETGHYPQLERRDAVIAAIRDFFAENA
jgi:pimeloyl-ACP methyl ester carboxylesterase